MNPVFDGHMPCGVNLVVLTEDSHYLSGGGIKTTWIMNCDLIAFMKKVGINITIKRQYETLRKGEYW